MVRSRSKQSPQASTEFLRSDTPVNAIQKESTLAPRHTKAHRSRSKLDFLPCPLEFVRPIPGNLTSRVFPSCPFKLNQIQLSPPPIRYKRRMSGKFNFRAPANSYPLTPQISG